MIIDSFDSFGDLEKQLRSYMLKALQEATDMAYTDSQDSTLNFYSGMSPKYYKRTYRLGNSLEKTNAVLSGNSAESSIYRDTDYVYDQGFPSSMENHGSPYEGVVPAEVVHEWAEQHTHGILGRPLTWQKTLENIEKDIDIVFGTYFNKA